MVSSYYSGKCNTLTLYSQPPWLSWMRHPTGDQEAAGSTPAGAATFFRGD